jgi:hypothetical protein
MHIHAWNLGVYCVNMSRSGIKYCHELGVRDYRRGMDLLTTCLHHSELQAITAL